MMRMPLVVPVWRFLSTRPGPARPAAFIRDRNLRGAPSRPGPARCSALPGPPGLPASMAFKSSPATTQIIREKKNIQNGSIARPAGAEPHHRAIMPGPPLLLPRRGRSLPLPSPLPPSSLKRARSGPARSPEPPVSARLGSARPSHHHNYCPSNLQVIVIQKEIEETRCGGAALAARGGRRVDERGRGGRTHADGVVKSRV